ncbi:MAG TPA: NADP-dependent malic enzyme [Muribaculum sp.]|jgi:malate dehydrogenase (oxaloacetate-decarboxylating)(NADP+)|uniref:NADP-dependent malic enzyme n=1 Tax=Heminiphilus faecis TaxID=2601703 RepID=UPI000EF5F503|nr:NADP-dependent malic enzyme [Heminiphilus faecis]RLT76136.1 NADP-dependent malic enzyme [bacterium J10(2018)]HRF68630.1 NADP-dependent malic enzyme [Muribaculum sp.]
MSKVTKEMALEYHREGKPGKIEVVPTVPYSSQQDLALAYSPGVAYPCLEIEQRPQDAYEYTNKGNLVAVISNGTAVLGLGDIGALAGKPVMEGKALLFKIFAGLDCFDIEVNEKDPEKFIQIVKALSPTFGGINLEDIKAPECFEIERRLKEECDIPVMHDDQHGTAIISAAGLLNALEIQGKKIEDVKLVVNGAGAAAVSCTKLYIALGVNPANVVMCDSKGVINSKRTDLNPQKKEFATTRDLDTLAEAMKGADVFLGLSVKDVVTPDMLLSMADKPIVFALANPDPEIAYDLAVKSRPDLIFATGRSDYPNQINNVLGFPYIFRGALDSGATVINEAMKLAAVKAIAALAKEAVPSVVNAAYGMSDLHFGRDYILPKPLDPRLITTVAPAVARGAMESGVAKRPITDWEAYNEKLRQLMGYDNKLMRRFTEEAQRNPKRVVFGEANTDNMLRAAVTAYQDGICIPVLLGNEEMIEKRAARLGLNIEGIQIVNLRHDREADRRSRFAMSLAEKRKRDGMTYPEALEMMFDRNYFGMMMVESGEADAMLAGTYSGSHSPAEIAREVVGIRPTYNHFATMHILRTKRGVYFLADTMINHDNDEETLLDIARLARNSVEYFAHEPVMAMVSYSNFGSNKEKEPQVVHKVVEKMHELYPDLPIDGEMQVHYALNKKVRDANFPFSRLNGKDVNTLIFPNLSAANTAYKMMLEMGLAEAIGPIQMGLNKPVHFINVDAAVRDIVNLATVAVLDAAVLEKIGNDHDK